MFSQSLLFITSVTGKLTGIFKCALVIDERLINLPESKNKWFANIYQTQLTMSIIDHGISKYMYL